MSLPEHAGYALAVMLVAGVIKGLVGIGMPTISVGLLGLVMSPMQAAALILMPTFVSNLWQSFTGPHLISMARRLWPLLVATAAGTWLCAGLVARAPTRSDKIWVGLVLLVTAVLALSKWQPRIAAGWERALGLASGLGTGLVNALTGTAAVPSIPYIQALGLNKDELIQAAGLLALTSTASLGLLLGFKGMVGGADALLSGLLLVPALGGVTAGTLVRGRFSEAFFRLLFLGCQGVLGAYLVWAGI